MTWLEKKMTGINTRIDNKLPVDRMDSDIDGKYKFDFNQELKLNTNQKNVNSTLIGGKTNNKAKYRRCAPYTIFSSLYDAAMGEAILPSIIDAFSRSLKKHKFAITSIADVGCGTGRFLRYLSRNSTVLYGVDNSPSMLKRAAANTAGVDVNFLEQDIRQLVLPNEVDCITCTFDTINYLPNRCELKRAFQAFARNLKPGGALVLDYIPEGASEGETGILHQFVKWQSMSSQWRIELDPKGRGSRVTILMRQKRRDGGTSRAYEVHEQRWHAPDTVANILQETGFVMLETSTVEPNGKNNWLHVVARLMPMTHG